MSTFLHGISAQFYRGIGSERQYICPFGQINFFIGPNNAGKSIALNLICSQLPRSADEMSQQLSGPEHYRGTPEGPFFVAFGFPIDELQRSCKSKIEKGFQGQWYNEALIEEKLNILLKKVSQNGFVWARYIGRELTSVFLNESEIKEIKSIVEPDEWELIWKYLSKGIHGTLEEQWIPGTLNSIIRAGDANIPDCFMIPAKRQLGGTKEDFTDLTGKGLIDHLAGLQNPDFHEQFKKDEFRKINEFLREVTGKDDAELEVPSDREHLLVHMDNKVLPLSSLGTGIHETVLIASFCTIHKKKILCLEEPEIHLHPVLQRKLIRYIAEKTDNQYFIATHSAALIDYDGASIFHVSNDGVQTRFRLVVNDSERHSLLGELGYKASDILQANFVIWVEGPSDRIYLRHWIKQKSPKLIEGIDYSIMFYGGGLIKHLSAAEERADGAIDDFIKILKLNRNCAIVMDSDREQEGGELKENAKRIQTEMEESGRTAWITAGREIENYISYDELQKALKACHPRAYSKPHKGGQFDHAFYFYTKSKDQGKHVVYKNGDKVGAASKVCEQPANFKILDLDDRVSEIVQSIRQAN